MIAVILLIGFVLLGPLALIFGFDSRDRSLSDGRRWLSWTELPGARSTSHPGARSVRVLSPSRRAAARYTSFVSARVSR
ncbi:MAG: hypothetical protein ACRDFX_05710 [Chloroflexota bacterium]